MLAAVKFKSKYSDTFSGRSYTYITDLPLKVGDIVRVPTSHGEGTAQVCDINIPASEVDADVLPHLKAILGIVEDRQMTLEEAMGTNGSATGENAAESTATTDIVPVKQISFSDNLITIKQLPIIEDQLRSLKDTIQAKVDETLSLACTEETVKIVKLNRSALNKEFTELENRRKEVKAAILAPYERFEAVYKECVTDAYRKADETLKKEIDEVESGVKNQKAKKIIDYFNELRSAHGLDEDLASWQRAGIKVGLSDSEKSLKAQVDAYINKVTEDLSAISGMEFADEILVEYKAKGGDLAGAIKWVRVRHESIAKEAARREAEAKAKAEAEAREAEIRRIREAEEAERARAEAAAPVIEPPEQFSAPKVEAPAAPAQAESPQRVYRVTFEVTGTIDQIKALKKFLTEGEYKYEQLQRPGTCK